jgi:hypothetical protein
VLRGRGTAGWGAAAGGGRNTGDVGDRHALDFELPEAQSTGYWISILDTLIHWI